MVKNSIFNLLGSGLNTVVSIASIPLLIKFLGLDGYGLWIYFISIIGFINLAEAGLSTAGVVFLSKYLENENSQERDIDISSALSVISTFLFLIGILVFLLIFYVVSGHAVHHIDIESDATTSLYIAFRLGSVYVFFKLLSQILVGIEKAYKRYDLVNIIESVQMLLLNIGLILIAKSSGSIESMALWWTALGIFSFFVHFIICRFLLVGIELRYSLRGSYAKDIFSFSSFVWGGAIAQSLFSQFDRIFVGSLLGAEQLGIYSAYTGICKTINTFSSVVVQPLVPEVSAANVTSVGGFSSVKKHIHFSVSVNIFLAVCVGGMLMLFSDLVLRTLFGFTTDKTSEYAFLFLIIVYTLYSFNAVGYFILLSLKKSKLVMKNIWISVLIFLLLLIICTKFWGLYGAIFANVGYLITLMLLTDGLREVGVSSKEFFNITMFPLIWFLLVCMVAILTVGHSNLLVTVSVSALLFTAVVAWAVVIGFKSELSKMANFRSREL